jgi:hypothetical protein
MRFHYCFWYRVILLVFTVVSCREIRPDEKLCSPCGEKVIAPSGAPVVPNRVIVTGTVQKFDKLSKQAISKMAILIESTEDVPGKPNLLKGKEGGLATFYSKEPLNENIAGKRVQGDASYRGDERGGEWWISGVKVLEQGL